MKISNQDKYMLEAVEKGYKISEAGQVISPRGNTLKLKINTCGYYSVSTKKTTNFNVHRIVAYYKFGDKLFDPEIEVRHLNGNKLDNSWNNIEIGNHHKNMMDIPEDVRKHSALQAAKKKRKLTENQVSQLRKDRKSGMTYEQLTCRYNIAKSTISYIVNRKTYVGVV